MQKNSLYIGVIISLFFLNTLNAQNDNWQWVKRGGGITNLTSGSEVYSTGVERVIDLSIDSNDNYYYLAEVGASQTDYDGTAIQTFSINGSQKDIFVFSTDCQGNFRWSKSIGSGVNDFAVSIDIDSGNNIYISGYTGNSTSVPAHFSNDTITNPPVFDGTPEIARKSLFIIKYDDQGTFQWLREPEGPIDNIPGLIQKTIVEPSGRIHSLVKLSQGTHLEGQLTVPAGEFQSAIVIYDSNGNLEDFFEINMQPGFDIYDYQLAYDPNLDRYYLADTRRPSDDELSVNGFGVSSGDDKGFYLAALDNQGQVLWYHESSKKNSWTLGDIAIDDNGDIYLTGEYNSDTNDPDTFAGYNFTGDPNAQQERSPFLIKLDSSGNLIWGTNATQYSRFPGRSIAIKGNDVYLGLGSLANEWDGTAFGNEVSGVGLLSTDNAILRFNKTSGSLQEVIAMPGTGFDMIMAMDIDSQDNIVVGGHFGSSLLDSDPALSVFKAGGFTDFFVAQYGQDCSLGVNENANNFSIKLYPQPASDVVHLQSQNPLSRYEIYDIQGKILKQTQLNNNRIDISELSTGLYFIKVEGENEQAETLKLIVE
jgi:hypothetical protein